MDNLLRVNDALDAVLLGAFLFGLLFTAVSLLFGALDLGIGDGGHGHGDHGGHDGSSPLTVGSILAFLAWFGGVAYLLRTGLGVQAAISLVIGIGAGLAGGWIIYRVLRLLAADEQVLSAESDRAAMAAGRVLSSIRSGGIGEIVYELRGGRQTSPARTVDGSALPAGAEVIVLRREGGVAVVQSWEAALEAGGVDSVETASRALEQPARHATSAPGGRGEGGR
jgi:hypothetical protein